MAKSIQGGGPILRRSILPEDPGHQPLSHCGQLVWIEHEKKNTHLFLKLLNALRRHCRRAKRVVLILDNCSVHKTEAVGHCLHHTRKCELLLQPVDHSWINRIERLGTPCTTP